MKDIVNPRGTAFKATLAAGLCAAALIAVATALPSVSRAGTAKATNIPDRPEDIDFPPLKYDPPLAADYRVTLKNGTAAYMVPDRSLPLVTIHVLMRLGPDLDPPGKEGLGSIMVGQLTKGGTSTLTAEQLEDRVAGLGAQLYSGMGSGRRGMMGMGGVRTGPAESFATLNLLKKDLDEGLALLVECLREPAFQEDRLELARDQLLQHMKERNDDTRSIEGREWDLLMDGEGHWTNRWPTQASVSGITRDDLLALHHRYVGPKNFILAVSGDFDRKTMIKKLDKAFSGWPTQGENPGPPPPPASQPTPGWFVVDKDVNQARVSFGLPGLDRYDKDWYAAIVMNEILGGGGFTSRLVNRIRSDEGLAYSVRSSLGGGVYYAEPWHVTFQTKVRSTAYAIEIALEEIRKMRDEPVSEEEVAVAKSNIIESLPAGFETSGAIAGALAVEELTGRWQRDPEFYADLRDRISAVTVEDVQRVAERLLDPARMTYLVVGNIDEVMLGDPKHDASIEGLAGGDLVRLPLRDPLTMKPAAD
jgi:zinc protease